MLLRIERAYQKKPASPYKLVSTITLRSELTKTESATDQKIKKNDFKHQIKDFLIKIISFPSIILGMSGFHFFGVAGLLAGLGASYLFASLEKAFHHKLNDFFEEKFTNPLLLKISHLITNISSAFLIASLALVKTIAIFFTAEKYNEKNLESISLINSLKNKVLNIFSKRLKINELNIFADHLSSKRLLEVPFELSAKVKTFNNSIRASNLSIIKKTILSSINLFLEFMLKMSSFKNWKDLGRFSFKDLTPKILGLTAAFTIINFIFLSLRKLINSLYKNHHKEA